MNQVDFNELQRWLASQQALWQQLQTQDIEHDAAALDWQPLLDACRKLAEQQGICLQSDLAEAIVAQTQGFCRYGIAVLQQLKNPNDTSSAELAILTLCQHLHEQAQQVLLRQWKLPEALARLLASYTPQIEPLNPLPAIEQLLQQLATQSKQQRVTDLAQELHHYNRLLLRYREQLLQLQRQVCQAMLQQTPQTQPDSLAALHALWVDQYENAYQQLLQQPDYQQLYGGLINSGMRLQQLGQQFWQDEYRMAGLVPRQDYDQLLLLHHALRKQLRRSERTNTRMDERLAQLEQQLEQNRLNTEQRLGQVEGAQVALVRKRNA